MKENRKSLASNAPYAPRTLIPSAQNPILMQRIILSILYNWIQMDLIGSDMIWLISSPHMCPHFFQTSVPPKAVKLAPQLDSKKWKSLKFRFQKTICQRMDCLTTWKTSKEKQPGLIGTPVHSKAKIIPPKSNDIKCHCQGQHQNLLLLALQACRFWGHRTLSRTWQR